MKKTKADDLLDLARKRFDVAELADQDNREAGRDDLQFVAGEHWPESVKAQREREGRPCLTINRAPQFLRQVTGDIRKTNPAIDVMPSDNDASEEMAEVLGGIIRNIEYQSDGSGVYERAAESAAACGIGNFRIGYDDTGRGYEPYIESIPNPFAVYWDPVAKDPTRKDARFCFVTDRMPRDDFESEYPDASPIDFDDSSTPDYLRRWADDDTVQVAEYWWKDGETVQMALISGTEVLEGPTQWPGTDIPIIAVVGEEIHIGDRVVRSSVIRHAKDTFRLYNYWQTAHAEIIALQPKAPYKLTPKQIEGHEGFWNGANSDNLPYLLYNPDERAPGAPQREAPPMASSAIMNAISVAADDMKATTGIYDAALGNRGNEQSGVAIKQRQLESDISTSIYVDNLSKSVAQAGRILVALIAKLYDQTRTVRTVSPDGATQLVDLNKPMVTPFGPVYMNDPSFGIYDVRIKTGPSYTTQRQEAAESMLRFVEVFREAAPFIGDLVAGSMDFPGADQIADRLKAMLPPGIAQDDDPTPEEQQAMLMQQQQAAQQAQIMQAMQQAEVMKATAEAQEAQSDAREAELNVAEKQLQLAMQNGQLSAAIQQMVQQAVAQALMGSVPTI